ELAGLQAQVDVDQGVDPAGLAGVEDLPDPGRQDGGTARGGAVHATSARGRLRMRRRSMRAMSPATHSPRAAAPRIAVNTLAGSPVASREDSMNRRPNPPRMPVEISATMAPTTAAVAASLSAGTR